MLLSSLSDNASSCSTTFVFSFASRVTPTFFCSFPWLCIPSRNHPIPDASNVSNHDRGWYCLLEKAGRRIFCTRRRLARNCLIYILETFYDAHISVQETDKATIDVEAQEDGIMGKILVCLFKFYQPILQPNPLIGLRRDKKRAGWKTYCPPSRGR